MISILIFAGLAISWVICDILNKKPFFLLLSILGIAYAMYSEWDPFYFSTQLLDHYPGLSALKLGIILFSFLTMDVIRNVYRDGLPWYTSEIQL